MITKMKHDTDRAKIYLFYTDTTCGIILFKMIVFCKFYSFVRMEVKIRRMQKFSMFSSLP